MHVDSSSVVAVETGGELLKNIMAWLLAGNKARKYVNMFQLDRSFMIDFD